jgi:periplasmic protein TonB
MSAPQPSASPAPPSAAVPPARARTSGDDAGTRIGVLGLVLGLHALFLTLVLAQPSAKAPPIVPPMMVSLLAPPQSESAPSSRPAPPVPPKAISNPIAALRGMPRPAASLPSSEARITAPVPSDPAPAVPSAASAEAPVAHADPAPAGPASSAPPAPARYDAAYLNNQTPYPPLARRLGESGTVQLRVLISAEGLAEKIELLSSSGSPRLDEGAQAAVRRWRFIPARQGDQAVASYHVIPIVYSLKEP